MYNGVLFDGLINEDIYQALKATQQYADELLRATSPVRSGLYRSQWQVTITGSGLEINNPTPYSSYLEDGTRKMAARNTLKDAVPAIESYFVNELVNRVGSRVARNIARELRLDAIKTLNNKGFGYTNVTRRKAKRRK